METEEGVHSMQRAPFCIGLTGSKTDNKQTHTPLLYRDSVHLTFLQQA